MRSTAADAEFWTRRRHIGITRCRAASTHDKILFIENNLPPHPYVVERHLVDVNPWVMGRGRASFARRVSDDRVAAQDIPVLYRS